MKKIYIAALCAIFAGTAMAAPAVRHSQKIADSSNLTKMSFQPKQLPLKVAKATASRAIEWITDPQGEKTIYSYKGTGISQSLFGISAGVLSGATDIVWDRANKKAYIHTPVGSFAGGYAEGVISDDGKKITVTLPQVIGQMYGEDEDGSVIYFPVYLSVMNQVEVDGYIDFVPAFGSTNTVEYNINDDGSVSMVPYQDGFESDDEGYLLFPQKYLSIYVTVPASWYIGLEDGEEDYDIDVWQYSGNISQTFTPLPDDLLTYDIPDNLNWDTNWRIIDVDGNARVCDVAIDGNNFYVKDLADDVEFATVVGTLADGKVTFKNGQYMGISEAYGQFIFLVGTSVEEVYDPDWEEYYDTYTLNGEDMVFTWYPDKKELVFVGEEKGWMLNGSMDEVFYYAAYLQPVLTAQTTEEVSVAPADPVITAYYPADESYDAELDLEFSNVAPTGAVIAMSNLAYEIYINGELMVFDATDYDLDEDLTEVPCTFSNDYIGGYGKNVYVTLFGEGIETIGVRAVNNAPDGKKYYSDIVTYSTSALQTLEVEKDAKTVRCFDLQGRPVANPAPGSMIIKVSTFADGSTRAVKVVK